MAIPRFLKTDLLGSQLQLFEKPDSMLYNEEALYSQVFRQDQK